MKKIKNKHIIYTSIFIALLIIIINTTITVSKKHDERLILSMKSNIEYYAKRCFLEEKCINDVTLQTLYDNNYITEVVNPVTKEVIDSSIIINYQDDKVLIDWNSYNI